MAARGATKTLILRVYQTLTLMYTLRSCTTLYPEPFTLNLLPSELFTLVQG